MPNKNICVHQFWILFCMIGVLILQQSLLFAQHRYAFLNEILTIGDSSESEHYLFRNPTGIRTDKNGNIYVSDRNSSQIKVFNKDGEFVNAYGSKGKGPGEFQEVTSFHVTSEFDLLIFDHVSQKMSIKKSGDEHFLDDVLSFDEYVKVHQILETENDELVIFYTSNSSYRKGELNLKIQAGSDFRDISIDANKIWDLDESFNRAALIFAQVNLWLHRDILLISPAYYSGNVFVSDIEEGIISQNITGFQPVLPTYKILPEDYINKERTNTSMYSGQAGRFIAKIYNSSRGITVIDNEILEFVFMDKNPDVVKNDLQFGVNRFTLDGEFLGFYEIRNHPKKNADTFYMKLMWKDDQDQLYFVDTLNEPVIRVMKISFED